MKKNIILLVILTLVITINTTYIDKNVITEEIINIDYTLEDYIIGVVASEMPASFEIDALKAQAIAARSYAISLNESGVELTDDVLTQSYIDTEQMEDKWGEDYTYYYEKIKEAVYETQNLVMKYEGEVITAFYFAISNGYTQESEIVFSENLDYIKSVDSSFDLSVNSYEVETIISKEEFKKTLNIDSDDVCIDYINYEVTGHISEISINNLVFSGIQFRFLLDLRSTDIQITIDDEEIILVTKGYGHGVGMSQYGANELAKLGYTYEEILFYFYENVEIENI